MTDHDDAQHALEQRALRNVRALVEKLEAGDDKRTTSRTVIGVIAVVAVTSIAVIAWLIPRSSATKEIAAANPASSAKEKAAATPPRSLKEAKDRVAELEKEMAVLDAERKAAGVPLTGELAKLSEEIDRMKAEYMARPRKRFVGARSEPPIAPYVAQVVARIESRVNDNYPSEIRGINGTLQMTIGISPDGNLESVVINRKASDPRLDAAAQRAVRLAAPFAPFPDEIRKDTDILYVTRTFEFRASGT